ncbi:MAG: sugar phosphate isomerase/epimerase [Lachnospiraceae bacterium]|nr:sugar phosphate isomerase/epimerase [Lachnospiraceae bacterium]
MIQIQPRYSQKEEWFRLAKERTLRFEILEFSSAFLNNDIKDDVYNWYRDTTLCDSIHGVFMDNYPVSPDEDIKTLSRKKCEHSVFQADMVGADNIVFHSTALTFCRDGKLENYWGKDAAEYYSELAEKSDKNIFIENFADVDYVPLKIMMENVKTEKVKICFDIGHANFSRHSLKEWFDEIGEYIGYMHISDNHGLWDDHLNLGEGNVDFALASDFVKSLGRDIPITMEVPTIESVENSLAFLEKNHYFGY